MPNCLQKLLTGRVVKPCPAPPPSSERGSKSRDSCHAKGQSYDQRRVWFVAEESGCACCWVGYRQIEPELSSQLIIQVQVGLFLGKFKVDVR